jgi:hypothetical protein
MKYIEQRKNGPAHVQMTHSPRNEKLVVCREPGYFKVLTPAEAASRPMCGHCRKAIEDLRQVQLW